MISGFDGNIIRYLRYQLCYTFRAKKEYLKRISMSGPDVALRAFEFVSSGIISTF